MSAYNIGTTDSPRHFMVLDAVSRGMNEVGKIARVTKLEKAEVELAVNDLAAQRLIMASGKRSLFGRRGLEVTITDTGKRLLEEKKTQLERKAVDLRNSYHNGDRQATQSFMNENRAWLPMMIFSGIMSALLFASMMSFAGMAMNPAESAVAGDDASAAANAQETTASDSGESGDGNNADLGADQGSDSDGYDDAGGDFGGDSMSF